MSTQVPHFLAVGHVTVDLVQGAEVLGGAALYASVQARALGLAARVLTAAHAGWAGHVLFAGSEAKVLDAEATTTFDYRAAAAGGGVRVPRIAPPLAAADLPAAWRESAIALLCPVLGEVAPELADLLRPRLLGVAPQGWLRALDAERKVRAAAWHEADRVLARAHAVFFSEADAPDADALARRWAERVPAVVVTRGARGATVLAGGVRHEVPARPAREVDATGAGDVFATAYLVAALEGAAPREAALAAAAAAACSVEGIGVSGIRGRADIEARRER